jgi:hypothetical protein
MNSDDNLAGRSYWWDLFATYAFPAFMFAVATVPGWNHAYSGHGGFAWFIAPMCFPWVTLRALLKFALSRQPRRRWYIKFYLMTLPCYLALAVPWSWAATASIKATFGLPVSPWFFYGIMVSPFPWFYFT